jgi:maleylpyruvate isomerase
MNETERRNLDNEVAGCALAHQRLLSVLDQHVETNDVSPGSPSALPDWTIGHVLTHLARNADGFRRMIDGAEAGEVLPMYSTPTSRDDDISAGADRPFSELVSDVRMSVWAMEGAWAKLTAKGWAGHGLARGNQVPILQLPWRRWREVELHHSDLGLAFTPQQWSVDFVVRDLPRRRAEWESAGNTLPDDVVKAAPWQQLAWLFGRNSGLAVPPPMWA